MHAQEHGIDVIFSFKESESYDITFTVDEPIEREENRYRLICFPTKLEQANQKANVDF